MPPAREALRALDTLRADVDAVGGVVAGHLDLVALPTLAVEPVTPLSGQRTTSSTRASPSASPIPRRHRRAGRARPLRRQRARHHRAAGDGGPHHDDAPRPAGARGHPPPTHALRARLDLTALAGRPIVTQRPGTSTGTRSTPRWPPWAPLPPSRSRPTSGRPSCPSCSPAGFTVVPRPMAAVAAQQGPRGRRLAPARAAPAARADPPGRAALTGRQRLHRAGPVHAGARSRGGLSGGGWTRPRPATSTGCGPPPTGVRQE